MLELQATPEPLHAVDDIELPGPTGPLAARLYRPRPGRLPLVLYLPGGGFVIGPGGYEAPLRQLALASECSILALRCRLAPEHRFPAAVEDAIAGAQWAAANLDAVDGLGPIGVAGTAQGATSPQP